MLKDLLATPNAEEWTEETIEGLYTYGYAQYKFGNPLQAMQVFQVLCQRRPLAPRFWFGLGASYQELEQYESACKAWAMAALAEESDPYPPFHAAECACSMHNVDEARLALKEAEKRIAKEKDHPLHERILALKMTWNIE